MLGLIFAQVIAARRRNVAAMLMCARRMPAHVCVSGVGICNRELGEHERKRGQG
jgi:hypothetical protein